MEKHEQGSFDVSLEKQLHANFFFFGFHFCIQDHPTQPKSPCRPDTSVHSSEVHVLRRNEYASMPSPPQLGALELA
jgi:hypothetical protein